MPTIEIKTTAYFYSQSSQLEYTVPNGQQAFLKVFFFKIAKLLMQSIIWYSKDVQKLP